MAGSLSYSGPTKSILGPAWAAIRVVCLLALAVLVTLSLGDTHQGRTHPSEAAIQTSHAPAPAACDDAGGDTCHHRALAAEPQTFSGFLGLLLLHLAAGVDQAAIFPRIGPDPPVPILHP